MASQNSIAHQLPRVQDGFCVGRIKVSKFAAFLVPDKATHCDDVEIEPFYSSANNPACGKFLSESDQG